MKGNGLAAMLMIAGGLLLVFGKGLPEINFGNPFQQSLAGTTVVLVSEKTAATVDQTLAIRNAAGFVEANELAGFLNIDRDDERAKPIVEAARNKKIEPPLVAYVELADKKVAKVRKIAPWKTSLEDSK